MDRIADEAGVSRAATISKLINTDLERIRCVTEAKILRVHNPEFATPEAQLSKLMPAIGSERRLRALVAIGHEIGDLQRRLGVTQQTMSRLINGQRDRITWRLASDIAELFSELETRPRENVRSRRRAQRENWAPPMAWDEDTIDDPYAEPQDFERIGKQDWFPSFWELKAIGLTDIQAIDRLGVARKTAEKRIRLHRRERG